MNNFDKLYNKLCKSIINESATRKELINSIANKILNNESISTDEFLSLGLENGYDSVIYTLLENPKCPVEILKKFLDHYLDLNLTNSILSNLSCPVDILIKYSDSSDPMEKCSVARNPNTPVEIIKKLSHDKNRQVRLDLVANNHNANVTQEVLETLSKDKDTFIADLAKEKLEKL